MRALLVGAGAVGQVFGRHLQLGGAEVAFHVRPKYVDACKAGLTLYPLKKRGVYEPVRWTDFQVLSSLDEVAGGDFDQVWLCMSTTALRGPWFEPFLAALGPTTTLVTLQPGLDQRQWLEKRFPAERTVFGGIAFISYQAPLEGETVPEPGIAYTFPPLSKSPFTGPNEPVEALLRALERGGCPAVRHADAERFLAAPTAVMMPHLAALELAGWKFGRLGADPRLALAGRASREALAISARHYGRRPPLLRHLVGPRLLRLLMWLAPRVLPFDIETYLAYHFTKVGDQTRHLLDTIVARGEAAGLPVEASKRLLSDLESR